MEEKFPVANGWLTCRQEGNRAELRLELPNDGRGLYRAWVQGPGGRTELGTLLPEGGCLRLARSFPIQELRRRGCWPVTGGQVQMTYAFSGAPSHPATPRGWARLPQPWQCFPQDPVLAQAARQAGPCLRCRKETGEFLLAWPWEPRQPFPLAPLFCLAQVKNVGGRPHVVFSFTAESVPVVPPGEP